MSTLGAVDGVGVHSNYGASAAEMKDGIFVCGISILTYTIHL